MNGARSSLLSANNNCVAVVKREDLLLNIRLHAYSEAEERWPAAFGVPVGFVCLTRMTSAERKIVLRFPERLSHTVAAEVFLMSILHVAPEC